MENPFTNDGLVIEEVGRDALTIPSTTPNHELVATARRIGELKMKIAAVLPRPDVTEHSFGPEAHIPPQQTN
jgi:hypothetical protein